MLSDEYYLLNSWIIYIKPLTIESFLSPENNRKPTSQDNNLSKSKFDSCQISKRPKKGPATEHDLKNSSRTNHCQAKSCDNLQSFFPFHLLPATTTTSGQTSGAGPWLPAQPDRRPRSRNPNMFISTLKHSNFFPGILSGSAWFDRF